MVDDTSAIKRKHSRPMTNLLDKMYANRNSSGYGWRVISWIIKYMDRKLVDVTQCFQWDDGVETYNHGQMFVERTLIKKVKAREL